MPKLVSEESCIYTFVWQHPIACGLVSSTSAPASNPELVSVDDCKFSDVQGLSYDLTSLANQDFQGVFRG